MVHDLDPLRRRCNDRTVWEQGTHHTLRVTGILVTLVLVIFDFSQGGGRQGDFSETPLRRFRPIFQRISTLDSFFHFICFCYFVPSVCLTNRGETGCIADGNEIRVFGSLQLFNFIFNIPLL